ncbi:MAG: tRNA (adenosine(37)-N6)-threonylcarbamoyltransferase complex ATPase subunit type 1 TsaE [Dehalococcoidia bacterium]|nr:tRNA (adenosine(37)-N6)-threonylcarbamoyltransferase complex ATPase subunit type 1 TsaE [Dehalococcoidia bacterium]
MESRTGIRLYPPLLEATFISISPEETRAIGRIVGEYAVAGDVVLLTGELGTGKTCLTQGILHGLGSDDLARSPTFVLISEHHGRMPLYHMDLYRVGSVEQTEELGIEEYLEGDGLTVVEWADNVPGIFPDDSLRIHIELVSEYDRRLSFTAATDRFAGMLEAITQMTSSC